MCLPSDNPSGIEEDLRNLWESVNGIQKIEKSGRNWTGEDPGWYQQSMGKERGASEPKRESNPPISNESKEKWDRGSFNSVEDSLECHFREHGKEAGAKDINQYVQKAVHFSENLRGVKKAYLSNGTPGAKRYTKNGKYIL